MRELEVGTSVECDAIIAEVERGEALLDIK